MDYNLDKQHMSLPVKLNPPWGEWDKPWPDRAVHRTKLIMETWVQAFYQLSALHQDLEASDISPKALDTRVALASDMEGNCGLMRSSIVTVAKELKAEEMVLDKNTQTNKYSAHSNILFNIIFFWRTGQSLHHFHKSTNCCFYCPAEQIFGSSKKQFSKMVAQISS